MLSLYLAGFCLLCRQRLYSHARRRRRRRLRLCSTMQSFRLCRAYKAMIKNEYMHDFFCWYMAAMSAAVQRFRLRCAMKKVFVCATETSTEQWHRANEVANPGPEITFQCSIFNDWLVDAVHVIILLHIPYRILQCYKVARVHVHRYRCYPFRIVALIVRLLLSNQSKNTPV